MTISALIHTRQPLRRLGFCLFTVVVVALLVKLGLWQLSRAEEKTLLTSQYTQRQQQSFTSLQSIPAPFYRVMLSGELLLEHLVWLDNQTYRGRVGYQLHIPLRTESGTVLVNFGWAKAPQQRSQLPEIAAQFKSISPAVQYGGIVTLPSQTLLLSGGAEADLLGRVQQIDMTTLSQASGIALSEYIVQLDATHPLALQSIWVPTVMSAQKHYGYALQWFLLAGAVFVLAGFWLRRT
ncbi:SURF1 family protein [Thaumasiovibrio sp. DFM-14]|uniref:SURF1 family protein n=1 Tax=Thaumasiovibrio sp. DFM-14 TaxID=3384792 RepID=UPI0039A1EC87